MSLTAAQRRASEMSKLQYSRAEKVREQNALVQELRGVIGAAQADHILTLRVRMILHHRGFIVQLVSLARVVFCSHSRLL